MQPIERAAKRPPRQILALALERIGDSRLADLVADEIDAYLVILDADGRILHLNEAVASAYEIDPAALLGQPISRLHEAAVALDREAVHRHVLTTDERMSVLGMLRGVLTATFYYPFDYDCADLAHPFLGGDTCPAEGTARALLCMARRMTEFRKPVSDRVRVLKARCHEMGTLDGLSLRELEVLHLSALGLTADEVANRIHRTRRTVESHRLRIARKLKVRTAVQLARVAVEAGITALELEDLRVLAKPDRPWTPEELARA